MDLFGNTYEETERKLEALLASDVWDQQAEASDAFDDTLREFYETDSLSDEEIVAYFIPRGLDFRDERGQPLRSTIFLARQAEAACREIVGKLPSEADAAERDWAAQLQQDAHAFLKRKTS